MSTPSRRRLLRDFKRLQNDPPAGISGAPQENNILQWNAVIFGPDDTPWEDGTFKLTLEFSEEYPNKAPKVKFASKMFHPNVYADGSICLDILQNQVSRSAPFAGVVVALTRSTTLPVVAYLRHCGHSDVYSVAAVRSQPEFAGQQRGGAPLRGKQARV
eukprot:TRINITY_DN756_c0_g1_i2.p1 TRINITY_DN756_c0_g1~~TRINITY_DN756_c0_g1_i2.p1  ORF type:complete len:174 (-),score=40.58 TRINITY_DN756_c0_g1_i2:137-613(-)